MNKLTQRDKIHNLLRIHHPNGLLTSEMIDKFREWDDDSIRHIKVEPVRRCLQELLARGLVRKEPSGVISVNKYGRAHEVMRWFAVVES